VSVSDFPTSLSTVSRFPFSRLQLPQCWHGRTEYWKLPAFLPNIQNVVTNFSCGQCLRTLLGPISLLYKQLSQYTLLKSFTLPSALLTKFPKKFHMKLLAWDIIFTKIFHENIFALTLPCFIWVSRAIAKHARIVLSDFLSTFKLCCERHYRNLATYNWCTTWREHVTKTAPARRRHAVGGGGAQLYVEAQQDKLVCWHKDQSLPKYNRDQNNHNNWPVRIAIVLLCSIIMQ